MSKTLSDRMVEYFSPQTAVKRYHARAMIGAYSGGGYNGASYSRAALGGYNPLSGDVNDDSIADLPTLRARSRDLVRNAPVAGGAINTMTTYVVGTGLSMRAAIDGAKLGLESGEGGPWQDEVNSRFSIWAESPDCDAARGLNFYGIQALAFRSMLESGDVLAILAQAQRGKKIQPVVQLIEADRLCNPYQQFNSDNLIDGVELDSNGAPLAYNICNQHPASWKLGLPRTWVRLPAFGAETDRRNVIHLLERRRPGQVRGVPVLAPVIEPLKQLARYTEAELQAAVISGAFAVFLKMDPNAFAELFDDSGRKEYMNSACQWKGDYPASTMNGPGRAVNLLPGESLEDSNPGRPNSEFDPFVKAILAQVGCELGLPLDVLTKTYESSYSAARAALLDAWRVFRVRRELLSVYFCQPVYESWLAFEIAAGRIIARGFFEDDLIRSYWTQCDWVGDGPGSIDESKDVGAAHERIDIGISTIADETIRWSGKEWFSNHKARANEHKMRVGAGLEPPVLPTVGQ
jgi:lambda family phage portal protein